MDTGIIILLIIIASALLGVLVFFLIKSMAAPRRIGTLQEQVKQGKAALAIRGAKQILTKEPRNNEAHYLLGQAYMQDRKYELALMEFKTVNQISDFSGICKESDFRKDIASLFIQFGLEEEALKEYILLTKLEPYESRHFFEVGKLLELRGKGSQAAGYYKKALQLNPRFSDAWFALGQLMYKAKQHGEAKDALQKALKLRPDNFKAYFYLGRILKDSRNFNGALGAFENAQKDPDFKIKAVIERGSCFLATKNYERAQNELERAIKLSGDDADSNEIMHARYFLSICYERTRNIDKAIEQWEIIYSRKKNFKDVAEKLSQYQELRGDDRIKDFITESPEKFEKTCHRLTEVLNLSVTDYEPLSEGCQITAVEQSTGQWRNTRKFPKFLRILRVPDTIDLPSVREFHEQMRKAGVNRGYFITSSSFTRSAYGFTESRPIDLIPRDKLQLMLEQAENLDKAGN